MWHWESDYSISLDLSFLSLVSVRHSQSLTIFSQMHIEESCDSSLPQLDYVSNWITFLETLNEKPLTFLFNLSKKGVHSLLSLFFCLLSMPLLPLFTLWSQHWKEERPRIRESHNRMKERIDILAVCCSPRDREVEHLWKLCPISPLVCSL